MKNHNFIKKCSLNNNTLKRNIVILPNNYRKNKSSKILIDKLYDDTSHMNIKIHKKNSNAVQHNNHMQNLLKRLGYISSKNQKYSKNSLILQKENEDINQFGISKINKGEIRKISWKNKNKKSKRVSFKQPTRKSYTKVNILNIIKSKIFHSDNKKIKNLSNSKYINSMNDNNILISKNEDLNSLSVKKFKGSENLSDMKTEKKDSPKQNDFGNLERKNDNINCNLNKKIWCTKIFCSPFFECFQLFSKKEN